MARPTTKNMQIDEDAVRSLLKELGVAGPKAKACIEATNGRLYIHRQIGSLYDLKTIRPNINELYRASEALLAICESTLWNTDDSDKSKTSAAHYIFQTCGFQIRGSEGYKNAESVLNDRRPRLVGADLLDAARHRLWLSGVRTKFGETIRSEYLAFLTALRNAAEMALKRTSSSRGRPSNEYLIVLVMNLAEIYREYTGKEPTNSRDGKFAKYLSICLKSVGRVPGDVMPLLIKALGRKPSLKERRQQRELAQAAHYNLGSSWPVRRR